MGYDPIPFPDLTGLRTTAHDRHTSTSFIQTEKVSSVSLKSLKELASRLNQDRTYQDIIIAVSLVILTHLLSPEDECRAQIALLNQDDDRIILQNLETTRQTRKLLQLSSILQQIYQTDSSDNSKITGTDNAILFSSENKLGLVKYPELMKDTAFMLIVEHLDDGKLQLQAKASPRHHTVQSADLHLDQINALLSSICDADGHEDTPVFSTSRFDKCFLAIDNEKAQQALQDIISGDLEMERFEYQFEKIAEKQPNHIALEFRASTKHAADDSEEGNISMNYSQVNEAASQIGHAIRNHSKFHKRTKEGHNVVALFLEKSHWTYIAILAVLKSGAAWCPIDTDWPSARRKALLAKSGASIVLSAGEMVKTALLEDLPEGMDMIDLDDLSSSGATETPNAIQRGRSSDDLAYLIWTSGTTGLPKAVGIQHKAAVQALRSLQEVIPYQDGKQIRYLQFSAYNFDLMILDMFYTWGLGGTLVSSTRATLLTDLVGIANVTQASHTLLTPAVMAMMPRESIPTLKVVINGGEKLSQTVADIWSKDCCLLNLYGPAEATLIAMNRRVPSKDVIKAPNIGRALPTTSCYAIDAEDNLVLKGAVGQLALGGYQCALGYIGDEVKSNEKFHQHPILGRVYKTGDMVRQLHNGEFEYLGRVDDQVKVNGIRIELLEINATIRSSVEVIKDSETLLVLAEGGAQKDGSEAQIVNFSVVPTPTGIEKQLIRPDEEALQIASTAMDFAQANLPTYMVPSLFLIVDHFPKTSSAKVDREALKSALRKIDVLDWQNRLASSKAVSSEEGKQPNEALQNESILREKLASICLIDESKVGRYTPFPQMGLDSIRAITLARKLNAAGMQVSVVDILNHSTVEKLALRILSNSVNSVSQDDKARKILDKFDQTLRSSISLLFGKAEIDRILPCTPLQESLIAETLQDPARYWLHRLYSLPEQHDFSRVKEAINEAVDRIEILRMAFVGRDAFKDKDVLPRTSFAQVVLKNVNVKVLEMHDFEDANDEAIALHSIKLHNIKILDNQCPLGFTYFKHSNKLVMHIHHALYDQTSLEYIDNAFDKAWRGIAIDGIQPFSKAIPSIVDLDENTIVKRKQAWEELLAPYPKGEMITLPKLSMHEDEIFGSSIESRRLVSSIKYVDLTKKAQEFGTSARPLLQTALAFVLGRLCDTEQIMLGDVVSGRAISSHLDNIVGPVLATMAVPIALHQNSTFKIIWDQVGQFHNRALPHAHFSLGQIRQILALPRASETFHAVFAFEPPADNDAPLHESAIKALGNYGIAVEHSLAIEMEVDPSGNLAIVLNAKKGMIDPILADQFLDELESAILQLLDCPDSPLSSIELGKNGRIGSVSRFQVSESIMKASKSPCYTRFYQHCESEPDKIAVEFHESVERPLQSSLMSYSQLLEKSYKLAQHLLASVPIKSVVAVTIPRSLDTYIALLAILRAGYVYLPIDVALPDQRKAVLLQESKAKCLICHSSTAWLKDTEGSNQVKVIRMNELAWQHTSSHEITLPKVDMQDSAYILFTSGSTGIPKGCVLSHENLSATLASFGKMYEEFAPGSFDKDVRFLARSVESFDVALLEALLPLQYGATIVTAPRHVILSDLGKAMQTFKVTHAAVVPSLFYIEGRRVLPSDLPNLRALIVGGERLTKDILEAWSSSTVPLLNAYGPTEACIGTSIAKVRPNLSTGNIGKPFGSTQYIVLKKRIENSNWSVAMRGESGELCIAGLQVGQYLNQNGSGAFIEWQGKRLYRTGDEVFMWPDDSIEYIGRIHGDTQVKLRGVRIELGEIDHVITQNEKDIRTITRYLSHSNHKHQIVMFAASSTSSTRSDEIRQIDSEKGRIMKNKIFKRCRDSLPSYMVPSVIVTLNYIPLAAISGKFDVKKLSAWYISQSDIERFHSKNTQSDDESSSRALTEVEQIIKNQVIRMFDVSKLKPPTDLFALGLDSLKIIALCGALNRSGLQIEISDAMSNPSIEGIAKNCCTMRLKQQSYKNTDMSRWDQLTAAVQKCVDEDVSVEYALPCLPLQASMVSQTLLEFQQWQEMPKKDLRLRYINVSRYKISSIEIGTKEKVKEAFKAISSRHSIYRTAFVEANDQIVQAVLNANELNEVNIKKDEEWEMAAVRSIAENMHRCPPLRYRITQEDGSKDIYLDLVIHHALYDGVSLDALFAEINFYLTSDYDSAKLNGTSFDSIIKRFEQVKKEDRLQYWQKNLNGCDINFFPCLTGYQINKEQQDLSEIRSRLKIPLSSIQLKAKEKKATVAMLILHAFAELYSKYVGESDVVVGLVLNGRTSEEEVIHGPCINTVPFRYKREKDDDDAIQQVRQSYAQALQYQHVSLADLARQFEASNGLFNTLFSFSGSTGEKKQTCFKEVHSSLLTEYPFAIEVGLDSEQDGIDILIAFDKSFIPLQQAEIFISQLDSILHGDHHKLEDANFTKSELSIENQDADKVSIKHFVDMFSEQVALRPQEVAFAFTENLEDIAQTCTYEKLNKVSDVIAFNLSKYSGDIVGVHMSQCAQVYPLLVGIWKAGKTYLPLDPKLPADRLDYIVSLTKPSIVVVLETSAVLSLFKSSSPIPYSEVCFKASDHQDNIVKTKTLDDMAYIMFTSGSSGKPKGVEISHRALAAALRSWKEILPHTPGKSRMLQLASPGFDVFLIEVCMPLALGFSFASAPKDVLLDDLEKTFHRLQLTMADLPAALATTVHPSNLPKLEWLMSGGEQMDQRVIDAWSTTGLINAWGPTEATIGNTLGFVEQGRNRNWIGYAYPTSSLYILQPDSNEILPRGCIGEIAVGGPQLANGYYDNPSLTAEKFIDVFIPGQSKGTMRLYRTGDRGRMLYDGSIECHGRIEGDGQVKINSQRVELEEIEIALKRQKGITNASVLYLPHPKIRSHQLVAFLTAKIKLLNGSQDDSDQVILLKNEEISTELSQQCLTNVAQSLPAYMVPQHCFILASASLPLTPNNKVDIKKLKSFYATLEPNSFGEASSNTKRTRFTKPMSETEKRLQKLISEFAGVSESEIESQTSLYRFGIDSISGLRLARFLRDRGIKGIRAQVIFSAPTVASIAASIDQSDLMSSKTKGDISVSLSDELKHRLSHEGNFQAFPCTPLQNGMLLESLVKEGDLYILHQVFRFKSDFLERVMDAVAMLLKRHEVLRSSFYLIDGQFIQVIHQNAKSYIDVVKTEQGMSEKSSVRRIQERHRAKIMSEKGLEDGTFHSSIIKGEKHSLLILTLHHALYDGESLELLVKELRQLVKNGKIDETGSRYSDILPALLPSPDAAEFWVHRLMHRQDSLIPRSSSHNLRSYDISCDMNIQKNDLVRFAREMSVSIHTIALYSYAKLLAGLTGQLCVTFAEIFSLRNNTDLHGSETIFGPCFNTILTSIEVRKNESTIEALQRLQREIDQGREYRNASLADIQRGLIKQRGSSCKIDALFNMQVLLDETMSEDNEIISLYEMEDDGNLDSTQYALNSEFVQRGDMLSLVIKAHQECFSKEHLLETVKNFESILNFTIKKPYAFSTEMPLPLNSLEGLRSGLIDNDQKQFSKSSYAQDLKDRSNDSPLQSLMFDTIGTVLQIDSTSISSETLLSSIGLDSIASMHLATRLRKKGVKVGVADIIQGKTVDGIIAKMQSREDETSKEHRNGELRKIGEHEKSLIASVAKQIDRSANEVEACLPTLPGQFFELIQSGESGIYVFAYQFRKGAMADVDRLQEAWTRLRDRHSILRTSFLDSNENSTGWQQIVLTKDADSISKIDSHSIQKPFMTAVEEDGLDLFTSKIQVRLQPGKCPVGISLIQSPEGDVLLIRLHHALYDAWSLPILMQELGNLYDNRKLEDVPDYTNYVRHVSQQRKKLSNVAQEYWKRLLGDQQVPRIPFKSIDDSSSREGKSFIFLQNALTNVREREKRMMKCYGGLPALIMASWATILTYICKPANAMKSTFGLYLTGRNESFDGIERMTGNLTNIVPVVASMEETNRCVYDTSKSVLLRLANQIKTQLDEHSHLDCFTSIKDILDWTGNDVIPWNSTLNLLWPREEGLVDNQANSTFTMFEDLLSKPYEKKKDKCERSIRSIDAYANVQIDIQFDPKTDNLHFGVKWDNALWSSSEVEKIMHDFCQLIQVGSAE